MPRYVVERDFPAGLRIPVDETGANSCLAVVQSNLADQVTWVHGVREHGSDPQLLRVRCTVSRGDSSGGEPQPAAGGTYHGSKSARSILLSVARTACPHLDLLRSQC